MEHNEDIAKQTIEQDGQMEESDDVDTTGATVLDEHEDEDTLVAELERSRAEIERLTDDVQRKQAELINYRRRMESQQEEMRQRAIESTLSKFLPIADDLDRAVRSLPTDTEENGWAEGFRLIESNLRRTLEAQGVTPMDSVGKPFDPTRHDAVMLDEDATGEHMVVEEFQRGYLIEDRVLRPAMVRVGSIATDADNNELDSGATGGDTR